MTRSPSALQQQLTELKYMRFKQEEEPRLIRSFLYGSPTVAEEEAATVVPRLMRHEAVEEQKNW